MRNTVVIGGPLSVAHPSFMRRVSESFDVVVFDMLELGRTLERLAGRRIDAAVILLHHSEFIEPMTTMISERGASVDHFFGLGDHGTFLTASVLQQMGFCASLDMTIISCVAQGMSDKEISERLHYSPQTIRNKISRMLHELGYENWTELAVAHIQHEFQGLLEAPRRDALSTIYREQVQR